MKRASTPHPLSQEGFDRLLAALGGDRDQAGHKYEALRRKLRAFFECRNCHPAEELADETLDRVSRRLGEGIEIRLADAGPYVYGVARNVARETMADASRKPQAVPLATHAEGGIDPATSVEPLSEDVERAYHCLDRCLETLPIETRQLLLLYHSGEGRGAGRKRRGELLPAPSGALWVRMYRLRKRLERCVRDCIDSSPSSRVKGSRPRGHSLIEDGEGA